MSDDGYSWRNVETARLLCPECNKKLLEFDGLENEDMNKLYANTGMCPKCNTVWDLESVKLFETQKN